MLNRRNILSTFGAIGAAVFTNKLHAAPEYPNRMIRYVVPFPAGGGVDILGRVLCDKLQEQMGQTVIVENRAGAGGLTGTRSVAKGVPDGYTLVAASFNFLTLPVLFKDLDFDIINDFEPISLVATFPMVLVVTPSVKANSLNEFIALCKSSAGLRFGSSSTGGGGHIASELFNQRIGVKNIHIPYRGAAPMNTDLLTGSIDFAFAHITSIVEQVRGGNVRALAVTSKARSPLLPNVPTMAEQGMANFDAGELHGVLAPAKTPRPIVDRLNREILAVLKRPEIKTKLEAQGAQLVGSSADEFAQFIKVESVQWGQVARDAGLKAS
jgi:tripartite-type tricarboxylate transporter receptor subunit TctC